MFAKVVAKSLLPRFYAPQCMQCLIQRRITTHPSLHRFANINDRALREYIPPSTPSTPNWAFQRTHYWIPKIQNGWDPPSWKSTWRHYFRWGWSDLDKISQTGAEWHVDCGDVVEIETRCRIPIWRTFGRIPWPVIPEPPAILQGAATGLIQWRVIPEPRSTLRVLPLSWFQSHMPYCRLQSPGEISVMIVPHCRV